ncbi:hypothetical protein ONE63_001644 [Megalurothrips usitatus]|uniref:Uncharacterized protein n=1 Tax=Megalurothrips usitatus TaxID=439358 RepID=A0AAV7X9X0_9NEOP|nr:hypothetical protein ONE63_001644 [Megalurothrips usitatus]
MVPLARMDRICVLFLDISVWQGEVLLLPLKQKSARLISKCKTNSDLTAIQSGGLFSLCKVLCLPSLSWWFCYCFF